MKKLALLIFTLGLFLLSAALGYAHLAQECHDHPEFRGFTLRVHNVFLTFYCSEGEWP